MGRINLSDLGDRDVRAILRACAYAGFLAGRVVRPVDEYNIVAQSGEIELTCALGKILGIDVRVVNHFAKWLNLAGITGKYCLVKENASEFAASSIPAIVCGDETTFSVRVSLLGLNYSIGFFGDREKLDMALELLGEVTDLRFETGQAKRKEEPAPTPSREYQRIADKDGHDYIYYEQLLFVLEMMAAQKAASIVTRPSDLIESIAMAFDIDDVNNCRESIVATSIKKLLDEGLVVRHLVDSRKGIYEITDSGNRLLGELAKKVKKAKRQVIAARCDAERVALVNLTKKSAAELNDIDALVGILLSMVAANQGTAAEIAQAQERLDELALQLKQLK